MAEDGGLLSAEEAQRALGVGRVLFWALVKRHGIPRLTQQTRTNSRGRRSGFCPQDIERLREPARRVLEAAAAGRPVSAGDPWA